MDEDLGAEGLRSAMTARFLGSYENISMGYTGLEKTTGLVEIQPPRRRWCVPSPPNPYRGDLIILRHHC
jgi:hypothetical protein